MKQLLLILLLFLCASCFAQNVINVRLYGGTNPFRNSQWNNWNVGTGAKTNIPSGFFNYANETSSPVSAILSGQDGLADNGAAYTKNAVICPDTVLRYSSYASSARTLTISGLDNGQKYDLEFYASRLRNDGQKTLFTIGTQTITVPTDNNSTNVANFSSIAPVTGKITIKMVRASTYNYISGFKISPTIVMNTGHKKIGVMGSSTAAGFFNNLWPADSSWARQLFHYYQFNTVDTLYNLAQSTTNIYNAMPTGYSAGDTLQPLATYASDPARNITKMISLHPDVILCHYPSNNYDYLTTAQVMFAMRTIKAAADSAGISLFFVGIQPRGSVTIAEHKNLININDSMIMEFGARTISYYDSVAKTARSFYMNPVFWLDNDSIHMNPKGHDVILRQIIKTNIFSSNPLIVSAGNNQTVTLPANFASLSGKIIGGSGNVVATTWSQLSGPAAANIGTPAALATQVSNLVRGTYVFKLLVIDSSGTSWTSTVQVIVNPVPPPTVSAGGNKVIILPVNSVTLSGTATPHGGGPIVAIKWTQISGNSSAVLSTPGSLVTEANGLSLGNYTFSLTVTDSAGTSGNDSAVITVASSASINVRLYSGINPFLNSQWNNWTVGTAIGNNIASGVLKYQDGSISTVSAVLSTQIGSADNGANYTSGASMCPDTVLRYCSYSTGTRTLVLSGLDNSRIYELEFYASRSRTDGQKSSFAVGSKTSTVLTDTNSSTPALLSSVSPVNGSITITITRGSVYNYLNGFKITQVNVHAANTDETIAIGQATEKANEPGISIYPNPVSESLTILNHGSDQLRIEIYDMTGRRIVAFSELFTKRQIGMSRLAAGTYIVVVTNEKTREIFRRTILKN
ncbi:MAG TPA: T9SS type A sorting domain-containing protein [Puia sp.]|nr:T9SS type A sorting domain-containing protein [Puia sp.]